MANFRRWSRTATGNATVAGGVNTINFAEGQAPSTVNNSAREMMAQMRSIYVPADWGWVEFSGTASGASQTVVKIAGNQTGDYTASRRMRLAGGSTTRYCTIVSSSYTSETTITVTVDSGSLSASHSLIALAAVDTNHVPYASATNRGSVELATDAETQTGTDTARAITPANLTAKEATAAAFRANTADRILTTDQVWSAADTVALTWTSGGSTAVDLSAGLNFTVTTATGNSTLAAPTNAKPGQSGFIYITQDAGTARSLSFASAWVFAGGTDPALTATTSAKDILFYQVIDDTGPIVFANLVKNVS
jgi:hypothetical protein